MNGGWGGGREVLANCLLLKYNCLLGIVHNSRRIHSKPSQLAVFRMLLKDSMNS